MVQRPHSPGGRTGPTQKEPSSLDGAQRGGVKLDEFSLTPCGIAATLCLPPIYPIEGLKKSAVVGDPTVNPRFPHSYQLRLHQTAGSAFMAAVQVEDAMERWLGFCPDAGATTDDWMKHSEEESRDKGI